MDKAIKHTLKGTIQWKVEKDGQTIRESKPYSNMILDQGLNYIASYAFADCFNYCVVGSGSLPPVATDTGLAAEIKRTNNKAVSAGANGASLAANVYTLARTFVFVSDVVPYTYRELGFSPLAGAGGNLFSKALFKDGTGVITSVTINPGETLTVRYSLSIEIFALSKRVRNALPGHNGFIKIQKVGLKGISDVTGETNNYDDTNGANEPSIASTIFISSNSSDPAAFGTCVNRSPGSTFTASLANYVLDSYGRNKGVLIKAANVPSVIRSVGVGTPASHGSVMVFDADQASESGKAYVITFSYYWVHQNESNFSEWLDGEDYNYLNKRLTKVNTYAYFAL